MSEKIVFRCPVCGCYNWEELKNGNWRCHGTIPGIRRIPCNREFILNEVN